MLHFVCIAPNQHTAIRMDPAQRKPKQVGSLTVDIQHRKLPRKSATLSNRAYIRVMISSKF